jgi:hypothetical protein
MVLVSEGRLHKDFQPYYVRFFLSQLCNHVCPISSGFVDRISYGGVDCPQRALLALDVANAKRGVLLSFISLPIPREINPFAPESF